MATLSDVAVFFSNSELRAKNDFVQLLVCKLEMELVCDPVCFALKYQLNMKQEEIDAMHDTAKLLVTSPGKLPGCISASAHLCLKEIDNIVKFVPDKSEK